MSLRQQTFLPPDSTMPEINLLNSTASDLQAKLTDNSITSRQLVKLYLNQIARYNGYLKAVIDVAPEELLDETAAELMNDNIATDPRLGLPITCGSLALQGSKPRKSASIIERLQAAGAIILGKANLSEWAWYRSDLADSGWSAIGGQGQSAYVRGGFREDDTGGGHSNPGGSSSGSAVAVAAGFGPFSIGTETMGSLIMPSDRSALYTIKPTLGLIPQEGIIPVTHEADSAGPMTKSVLDLANLLDVLVDPTKTTVPEGGYKSAVTGEWGDINIGLRDWALAYENLQSVVKVVKPITLISTDQATENGSRDIWDAFHTTFKSLLEDYLASVDDCKIDTLEDLVNFNKEHADLELPPSASNQAGLIRALNATMSPDEYTELINYARDRCGKRGIDKALEENDQISDIPSFKAQQSNHDPTGYPVAFLPLGYLDFNGRPFGLQITAKAHQEALPIQAQSAWEATMARRQPPPLDEIVR
ncbi:amidase family protein [Penicillium malachiteum]|nr:amidase family protein [Penicillium malachiteum]